MKTFLMLLFVSAISAGYIHSNENNTATINATALKQAQFYKQRATFSCAPDLTLFNLEDSSNTIPLLDGWGHYEMPVTTNNDSAHIYFEQGINMYYGFHIIESLASFDKATHFDPGFAMGYWGKALAYGPNINDLGYAASPDALKATQKAKELSTGCTSVEKALIYAMQIRYSEDTTQTREFLNQLYANAMKKTHQQFTSNADVAALYADALMVQHPWDLYDKYGKPKPWTPEIVNTLELLLKADPKHPGGSHYYIHAIEGSDHPEKGLAVAKQLPDLMPGVAHLVHMPSHIYIRSGYYKEGIDVNENAITGYYNALNSYPAVANGASLYLVHAIHMQATCANMDGNYAQSIKISNDCKNSFDSSFMSIPGYLGVYVQYVYMTPVFTDIRFGKWDNILNTPSVPDAYVYAKMLWHYGRGLAYARQHNFDKANSELNMLRASMSNPQLQEHPDAFNPGIAGAGVAEKLLQGIIAEEMNDLPGAIDILQDARDKEDEMIYNEPKDWPHPVRQYLGNVYLKAGNYAQAEQTYRQDLKINPNNGWSLSGLATALQNQNKNKEATTIKAAAAKAFERSDIKITTSVF